MIKFIHKNDNLCLSLERINEKKWIGECVKTVPTRELLIVIYACNIWMVFIIKKHILKSKEAF